MASKQEMLIEANNRGLLKGKRKQMFDEAVNRGLIQLPDQQPSVAPEQETPGFFDIAGRASLARFLDNFLNVPNLVAQGMDAINPVDEMAQLAQEGMQQIGNQDFDLGRIQQASMLQTERLNTPTSSDVFGAAQVAGEGAANLKQRLSGQEQLPEVASLQGATQQQEQISQQRSEDFPGATGTGNVMGDIATMLTGRSPFAKQRALSQVNAKRAVPDFAFGSAAKNAPVKRIEMAPNMREAMRTVFEDSKTFKTLLNRAGRATEAGLEGATLSLLTEGDPLETASYAAGGQAAGSVLLSGMSGLFSGGPLKAGGKLALSAASIGALLQMAKSVTPGGKNFSLESLESGFDKVALGIGLGMLSGIAGAGRVTSNFPVNALPKIADTITSLPRAGVISTVNEALQDPTVADVINKVRTDPEFFGKDAQRQLLRAIESKEKDSLRKTIDRLKKNRKFREKFEALD